MLYEIRELTRRRYSELFESVRFCVHDGWYAFPDASTVCSCFPKRFTDSYTSVFGVSYSQFLARHLPD